MIWLSHWENVYFKYNYWIFFTNHKIVVEPRTVLYVHVCMSGYFRVRQKGYDVRLQWNSISCGITDSVLTFIHLLWETTTREQRLPDCKSTHTHTYTHTGPCILLQSSWSIKFRRRSSFQIMCHFYNGSGFFHSSPDAGTEFPPGDIFFLSIFLYTQWK